MNEYYYPKTAFSKSNIAFMQIFFHNGDFLTLSGSEIADIALKQNDALVWDGAGYHAVAAGGFIKLNVREKVSAKYKACFLCDKKEYAKDRRAYIENRLVNHGGIERIRFCDKEENYKTLSCGAACKKEGETLTIEFLPQPQYGACDGAEYRICLGDIDKNSVNKIAFEFLNCDMIAVYKSEILDCKLIFDEKLCTEGHDYIRKIKGGHLKLKLDGGLEEREELLFIDTRGNLPAEALQERFCDLRDNGAHDICMLTITSSYALGCRERREYISVGEICTQAEIEAQEAVRGYSLYTGGFAKLQDDGVLFIAFGDEARKYFEFPLL